MNLSDIGTKIIRKIREIEQQIRNLISDDVYSSSWDGITTIAPSKNAVYDKIELVVAGGEVNTGSNVGTDGIGVYDGKVGVDLQFRHIAPASSAITVVENGNDIDIDLSHLGIEDLGDAGADKILFWDDSESKTDWLVPNTGLVVDGTNLNCSITQYTNNDADARIAAASHDTLLNPNGNAEEQHMTSAQITALHAAVTVNAPIVLTGQDIELKNDANVQITEIDTGALAASDTTIPTSNTVKEAVDLRLLISEIDDTPVNGITNAPISSNWAFDHAANTTTAHGAVSAATASKHVVRDASGRAKFVASAANGDAVIHEQLHSAVTVTAPISVTGQLIKLVNDADATITEFDTSALANSDTKVPTNTTVKEYVDLLKEQSATFPGSPVEGDFHYDEDDDSLYRYNGEAEAWVEVGTMGAIASSTDNLGNHIATEAITGITRLQGAAEITMAPGDDLDDELVINTVVGSIRIYQEGASDSTEAGIIGYGVGASRMPLESLYANAVYDDDGAIGEYSEVDDLQLLRDLKTYKREKPMCSDFPDTKQKVWDVNTLPWVVAHPEVSKLESTNNSKRYSITTAARTGYLLSTLKKLLEEIDMMKLRIKELEEK